MRDFEEKECLCALNRIFGFEPKIALALISHLGSARAVFEMSAKELDLLLGPYSKYRGSISPEAVEQSFVELEELCRLGIQFTGCTLDDYPSLLKECEDAPVGLYVRSATPASRLFGSRRKIAIVGTRDLSSYGKEWCESIVEGFGRSTDKPTIISGLALGTDICAHRSAIGNRLTTIGVMATGPEAVYPSRHRDFAESLAATPGCALITDYPPHTAPLAIHFLRRNRIIAGMSEATILIESRIKGGGMMTARLAFGYSREVYALPGRVDDIRSQGCNNLIKNKIAEPITSVGELLESLRMKAGVGRRKGSCEETVMQVYAGRGLDNDTLNEMTGILLAIRRQRGISIEELALATGMDYRRTVQLTGILESDGIITIDLLRRCCINTKVF